MCILTLLVLLTIPASILSFIYVRNLTASNPGGLETDLDVMFSFDSTALIQSSKMRPDCEDLLFSTRFLDGFESNAVSFWMENGCGTSLATVILRFSTLPSGDSPLYMYYGFPSILNSYASSFAGTFIFLHNATCDDSPGTYLSVMDGRHARLNGVGGMGGSSSSHVHGSGSVSGSVSYDSGPSYKSDAYHTVEDSAMGPYHEHSMSVTYNSGTSTPKYRDIPFCTMEGEELSLDFLSVTPGLVGITSLRSSSQSVLDAAGWEFFNSMNDDRLPRCKPTYDASSSQGTHSHRHSSFSVGDATNAATISIEYAGTSCSSAHWFWPAVPVHTHTSTFGSDSSDSGIGQKSSRVTFIRATSIESTVFPGLVLFGTFLTSDQVPFGWEMDSISGADRFVLGSSSSSIYGQGTGSGSHAHTFSTSNVWRSGNCDAGLLDDVTISRANGHSHSISIGSATVEPLYYDLFLFQRKNLSLSGVAINFDIGGGELMLEWTCHGRVPSDERVCNDRKGVCIGLDFCDHCIGGWMGTACEEGVFGASMDEGESDVEVECEIPVRYVTTDTLESGNERSISCSELLDDVTLSDVVGSDSLCTLIVGEAHTSFARLVIATDTPNLNLVSNASVTVKSLTNEFASVTVYLAIISDPFGAALDVWIQDNWYILLIVGLIASLVVVFLVMIVICTVASIVRQKKRLARFDGIEDIDIMLAEKKTAGERLEGEDAILKMNMDLFRIPFEEIKLVKSLGAGGSSAEVFMVHWQETVAAMKLFRVTSLNSEDGIQEFEIEVEVASSVNHPNVLRFFGASLKSPRIGILMEFCEGGDLQDFIGMHEMQEKQLPFGRKIDLLQGIAKGMGYLHSRSICHRDLKPQNVLLDAIGVPKLMDFGLSRTLKPDDTHLTVRKGTSYYMAPEITIGSGRYDLKVDVYSYSIIMYQILACTTSPYGKDVFFNVEVKAATDENFRPKVVPNTFPSSVSRDLIRLMQQCWSHDPTRKPSFDQILQDMSRYAGEGIQPTTKKLRAPPAVPSSRPPPPPVPPSLRSRRAQSFQDRSSPTPISSRRTPPPPPPSGGRVLRAFLEEMNQLKAENDRLKSEMQALREQVLRLTSRRFES